MKHFNRILCIRLLAVVVIAPHVAGTTEVFLSPQCETHAGYDSNRYRTEEAEGSSFLALKPSLELNVFITETVDINGFAFHQRNEFLREGFTHSETSGGTIIIHRGSGVWDTGISISGLVYRDAGVTENGITQVGVSPRIAYTHIIGTRYSLEAFLGGSQYESLEAFDRKTVNGVLWALRPRAQWPASLPVSLWAEGFMEGASSDEEGDEYDGYGLSVGLDYTPSGPLSTAFGLRYGSYRQRGRTGSLRDAFSTNISLSYRANTWTEIQTTAGGGTFWNRSGGFSYDRWQLGIALRLVYDLEIGSSSI